MVAGSDTWQHESVNLPASLSGRVMRLVFSWENDEALGEQPPIAIDNVSITAGSAGGDNASLSTLSVTPGALSPVFNSNITYYTVSVPNETTSIMIDATPANPNATVSGAGSRSLSIGENNINIIVTAQDGVTTKTYTVSVTRQAEGVTYFTVAFNAQGGSAVASQTIEQGGKLTQPANPAFDGFTFGGWYKEAACINAWDFNNDVVTGNMTLYAKWTEGVTGAEDIFAIDLNIYPNPFTGAIRIIDAGGGTLRIVNSAGVIVHTQLTINPDETLRLEHLPAGVYFFMIEKDGKTKTVKAIKN